MIPISVIIPVYNSRQFLRKCVASLCSQTDGRWEAILVDDGSTDGSGQLCDELVQEDARIRVIHKPNGGVSDARNVGIAAATGERVLFLDSDDTLAPEAFAALQEILKEYDYDVIAWSLRTDEAESSNCYPMSSEETFARKEDTEQMYDLRLRAFSGWSAEGRKDASMHFIVTKLIRRSLITDNHLRFDTGLKYHEDTLFCNQVMEAAESAAAVNRYFYIRTLHGDSASVSFCNTIDQINRHAMALFRAFIDSFHPNDSRYELAFARFQLAWFVQVLKLDCMNPRAAYTGRERIRRIGAALEDRAYCPASIEGLKRSHRILAGLIRMKMKYTICLISSKL